MEATKSKSERILEARLHHVTKEDRQRGAIQQKEYHLAHQENSWIPRNSEYLERLRNDLANSRAKLES